MRVQRPPHDQIARRAYELYLARGGDHGYDRDDWLQAEYELMQLPVRKLAELEPPQAPAGRPKSKDVMPSIVDVVHKAMSVGSRAGVS